MSNWSNCNCICILIDDCTLCKFVNIPFTLSEIPDVVNAANFHIEQILGADCWEMLCEESENNPEFVEKFNNKHFHRLYSELIKYNALCEHGGGKFSCEGVINKTSDDWEGSDWKVNRADLKDRKTRSLCNIELYEKSFKKWLAKNLPECIECESKCDPCEETKCDKETVCETNNECTTKKDCENGYCKLPDNSGFISGNIGVF